MIAKLGSARRTLLVATQLESACAVRTDFERPGTMSRARPRSLLAWIHRSTAWWMGLGGARKGDARGERSVWVVPLHRLAPSYQFSHRNYGRPSQNFEKRCSPMFFTKPPTPPIPSDPRGEATPRTSFTPKSGDPTAHSSVGGGYPARKAWSAKVETTDEPTAPPALNILICKR